ncbi:MAG: hypothetical protein SH847_24310 [Roseiflexaceae bacterium]|nr:hypothetical protein [Roseiflexaceae bacterium]
MSGGLKAGLIFAAIAIPLTILISWVPYLGVLCCGPLMALGLGAGAGYLGVRWAGEEARIGQGILAGGLTGAGALIGSVVFFVLAIAFISNLPEFEQALREALQQQDTGTQLTTDDMRSIMGIAGPAIGFCIGLFGLLFGLGGGALGGWLRIRQRNQATPPMPPVPPVSVG